MPPLSPHTPQPQNTAGAEDPHGPPSNGNSSCPGSWGLVLGHTWAARWQNRDVSSATRPRKEPAEPGISEQPLIRRLGEFTHGSRGACPRLLTPQSPTSNLPHVPNTGREPSAQSHHAAPQACLQSSGLCPWCRSRVRAARWGAARAQRRVGMLELRGRQRPRLTPDPKAPSRGQSHPGSCPDSGYTLAP